MTRETRQIRDILDEIDRLSEELSDGAKAWEDGTDECAMASCDPSDQYMISEKIDELWKEAATLVGINSGSDCKINMFWSGVCSKGTKSCREEHAQDKSTDPNCSNTLRLLGKPYPRTCKVCGLGPCKSPTVAYKTKG